MTGALERFIAACLDPYKGLRAMPGVRIYLRTPGDVTDLGINGLMRQLELLRAQDEPYLYAGFYLFSDDDLVTKLGRPRYSTFRYAPTTWHEWEFFILEHSEVPGLDELHLLPSALAPASLSWLIITEDEVAHLCRVPGPYDGGHD